MSCEIGEEEIKWRKREERKVNTQSRIMREERMQRGERRGEREHICFRRPRSD